MKQRPSVQQTHDRNYRRAIFDRQLTLGAVIQTARKTIPRRAQNGQKRASANTDTVPRNGDVSPIPLLKVHIAQ